MGFLKIFVVSRFLSNLCWGFNRAADPRIQREKQREREAKIAAKENKVSYVRYGAAPRD